MAHGGGRGDMFDRAMQLDTGSCVLPSQFFASPAWQDGELQAQKRALDAVKNKLDDLDNRDWDRLAALMDLAAEVKAVLRRRYQVELGTVAWAKMFELLALFPALVPEQPPGPGPPPPPLLTVHLCEAPGAFICALNHWLKTHSVHSTRAWDWMATSLNPYYEGNDQFQMNDDDKLISATLDHWCWGADNSGDLRDPANIRAVWGAARQRAARAGVPGAALVTADGGVDCSMAPDRQEEISSPLHFTELVTAAGLLAPGGCLVYKAFTQFHHSSICLLHLMGCLFDAVHLCKPGTSKSANSEVYVLGLGFRGLAPEALDALLAHCSKDANPFGARSLVPVTQLPTDFLASAKRAAAFFADCTAATIRDALARLGGMHDAERAALKEAKACFAEEWVRRTGLRKLPRSALLVPGQLLDGSSNNTSNVVQRRRELEGRLQDRRQQYRLRREQHGLGEGFLQDGGGAGCGPMGQAATHVAPSPGSTPPMGDLDAAAALPAPPSPWKRPGRSVVESPRQQECNGLPSSGCRKELEAHLDCDWAPAPDAQALLCRHTLGPEDAAHLVITLQPVPPRIIKSKFIPDDSVLVGLRAARQQACLTAAALDLPLSGCGLCTHTGPCVAPRASERRSQGVWHLAALDAATGWLVSCMPPGLRGADAEEEESHEPPPVALDLSLGGSVPERAGDVRGFLDVAASSRDGGMSSSWRVLRAAALLVDAAAPAPRSREDACRRLAAALVGQHVSVVVGSLGDEADATVSTPAVATASRSGQGALEVEHDAAYRRRVAWEVAAGLACVAEGGALLLRLSDCLTMWTMGLLYLLHRSFSHLTLLKPFTSCVCDAERFVVCSGRLPAAHAQGAAAQHALAVLARMEEAEGGDGQGASGLLPTGPRLVVGEVVAPRPMLGDVRFYEYVASRTQALAQRELAYAAAVIAAAASGDPASRSAAAAVVGTDEQVVGVMDVGEPARGEREARGGCGRGELADVNPYTALLLLDEPASSSSAQAASVVAPDPQRVAQFQALGEQALLNGAAGPRAASLKAAPQLPGRRLGSSGHLLPLGFADAGLGSSPAAAAPAGGCIARALMGSSAPAGGLRTLPAALLGSSPAATHHPWDFSRRGHSGGPAGAALGSSPPLYPGGRREGRSGSWQGSALGTSPAATYASFHRRESPGAGSRGSSSPRWRQGGWATSDSSAVPALGRSPHAEPWAHGGGRARAAGGGGGPAEVRMPLSASGGMRGGGGSEPPGRWREPVSGGAEQQQEGEGGWKVAPSKVHHHHHHGPASRHASGGAQQAQYARSGQ